MTTAADARTTTKEARMNPDQHIRLLQHAYANALADAVLQMTIEGVLERITERKRQEQLADGATKAASFGITSPDEVFTALGSAFGCASWTISPRGDGFEAEAGSCLLCAQAKQKGADSPCRLYCFDPMAGMVKGLDPEAEMQVQETLWNGTACRVEVRCASANAEA
jgi:hypothetical protein